MHRPPPTYAAVLAALLLIGLFADLTYAVTPETLAEAHALLEKGQARRAVASLEEALTATPDDRQDALLDLLREAYSAAAKEAQAHGRTGDAELYRDNLEILIRKHPAAPQSPGAAAPTPAPAPP